MTRLIPRAALRALLADAGNVRDLVDAVGASVREARAGGAVETPVMTPGVAGALKLRVQAGVSAATGAIVRASTEAPGGGSDSLAFVLAPDGTLDAVIGYADLAALRTGAAGALACRHVAPDAETLGVIGSGAQAAGQVLALARTMTRLRRVAVYSPTEAHRTAFAAEMARATGAAVEAVATARAAVADAEVLVVATDARRPVLEDGWLKPGAFVISVADAQLPPDLVARAKVVVSDRDTLLGRRPARQPYTDLAAAGRFRIEDAADIADLVEGTGPVAGGARPVVLELPGMVAWDIAAAAWAIRLARRDGVGEEVTGLT